MFLIATHAALADVCKAPELALDKEDANDLAVPLCKVAALYDLKIDPRIEAYGMLLIAAAKVYAPRALALRERLRAERARNVTPKRQAKPPVAPATAPKTPAGAPMTDPDEILRYFGQQNVN